MKCLFRTVRIGYQFRRISGTPWTDMPGHFFARDLFYHGNNFLHGIAASRAQVDRNGFSAVDQMLQSLYMCLGQIVYMDVIANACVIRGGIIIAKNS